MILSVLSSPALVSGLMVARAKNPVHSVLFPIPVFRDTSGFCPIIKKLKMQWKLLLFSVAKVVLSLLLMRFLFSMGYLWVDELSRALSQFHPGFSGGGLGGGLGGGSGTPPTGPSDGFLISYSESDQDQRRGYSELPVLRMTTPELEIIGGDSVRDIQRRLLANYPERYPLIELARIEAEDLFEVKAQIIQRMALYDPTGDWMARGARALDNPRTASGEHSLEQLYRLLSALNERGKGAPEFWELKNRVFLKKGGPGGDSIA
ncbi:unnamed protein product [Cochlearia groenlandica]